MLPWTMAPIVLVEDDANDRFFVEHSLIQIGLVNPVLVCASVGDAKAAMTCATPVVAIIDIHLDGLETGLELLAWLREQPAPIGTTPVMMLTGSENPEHQDQSRALGAVLFLQKPVRPETLTAAVQSLGFVIVTRPKGKGIVRILERR